MKAREYAAKFEQDMQVEGSDPNELVVDMSYEFVKEFSSLLQARNVSKGKALLSAVREADSKWQALRGRLLVGGAPLLREGGFMAALEMWMPGLYKLYEEVRVAVKVRKTLGGFRGF